MISVDTAVCKIRVSRQSADTERKHLVSFGQRVVEKTSTTYSRSRPVVLLVWQQLAILFTNLPEQFWKSAITLDTLMVRLGPQIMLSLCPLEIGNDEMLHKLKSLVDEHNIHTCTRLIEEGLTNKSDCQDDADYAWVKPLYSEILKGILDFEKQSVQNFKEKCTMPVPISWADLDECKELWIQVVFAKISHNSDADSSHPIRDNRQLVPLNYYRLIDYFDNPTDFLKFLWMTVKIYHGLLRFPGKTFTDIFKPMDRYFDNIRTSITQKVKKCNGVVNGILAVATCAQLMYATTCAQLMYATTIFKATVSQSTRSPSAYDAGTSCQKLHFIAAIPKNGWDNPSMDTKQQQQNRNINRHTH